MKKIIFSILILFPSFLISQSIEIISYGENPLVVNPITGSDLTVNYKYTSEAGSTGNHIFIGLEVLDENNNYVSYVNGKTLENQTPGTNKTGSVSFFVGSIHKNSSDLPTGHYYQVKATLYATGSWTENAWAGYWNSPKLTIEIDTNQQFSTTKIAKGADISWMTEMEDQGYTWKDNNGNTKELMPLLKEYDLDAVRLRVWVNPENSGANGWCDIDDLVVKAEIAKANNLDIMLTIHYSDWWADPGKQNKPSAWANYSVSQLETAVTNHTTDILNALKSKGITPKWVQIGNETNDGMLWTTGKASTGGFANYAKFLNAGANAVKTFNNDIKTILHLAEGNNNALFKWNIGGLINNGFQLNNFDIIGMSLYPNENNWKTYVDDTYTNMIDLKSRYNKEVMMVEIGFAYNRQDISYQFITYMIEKTKQANGLGVFYWEPIARSPFTSYEKGAWDSDGSPSIAMDAFSNQSTLRIENVKNVVENFSIYPNPIKNSITVNTSKKIIYSLKLYDIKGYLVKDKKGNKSSLEVDISKLTPGIYFLNINNKAVKKIVKL
ncbi:glycosyl hydrolase 53 family protein [Polaribacter sp.]|uniref:glycosyl hydrolase 53 family protein n=1 Tax=Polaribacter sp. TaxID=1920175 RepID=UPI003F6BEB02